MRWPARSLALLAALCAVGMLVVAASASAADEAGASFTYNPATHAVGLNVKNRSDGPSITGSEFTLPSGTTINGTPSGGGSCMTVDPQNGTCTFNPGRVPGDQAFIFINTSGSQPASIGVTAHFSNGATDSATATLCPAGVGPNPPTLPNGTVGNSYSVQFAGEGGSSPYTFSHGGALPPGTTLAQSGLLSGTPSQDGTFNSTILASDANGCTGFRPYSVSIDPASSGGGNPGGTGTACAPVQLTATKSAEPADSPTDVFGETNFLQTGDGHYVVSALKGKVGRTSPYRWYYVVTVTNPGPCDAANVLVTDVLPQEFVPRELGSRMVAEGSPAPSLGPLNISLPPDEVLGDRQSEVTAVIPALPAGTSVKVLIRGQWFPRPDLRPRIDAAPLRQLNEAEVEASNMTAFKTNTTKLTVSLSPGIKGVEVKPRSISGEATEGSATGKALRFIDSVTQIDVAAVETFLSGDGSRAAARKKRCSWLANKRARFRRRAADRRGRCSKPIWLRAKGTRRWALRLTRPLPQGRYTIYVRATNRAGIAHVATLNAKL